MRFVICSRKAEDALPIHEWTRSTRGLRLGNALSVLRKHADGRWQVVRDANMLA